MGAKLLSQALESVSTNLSSVVPPKEPITVETTDVSNKLQVTEDEHLSNSPPDATKVISMQEQKINHPLVEDNPINIDTLCNIQNNLLVLLARNIQTCE